MAFRFWPSIIRISAAEQPSQDSLVERDLDVQAEDVVGVCQVATAWRVPEHGGGVLNPGNVAGGSQANVRRVNLIKEDPPVWAESASVALQARTEQMMLSFVMRFIGVLLICWCCAACYSREIVHVLSGLYSFIAEAILEVLGPRSF